MSEQRIIRRYSHSFKQHIIGLIESGQLTIEQARQRYDIRGGSTIQGWLKSYGRYQLLSRKVRIEMPDEVDQIKALKKENRTLESALAQSQVKILALEALIAEVEADLKIDVKKSTGHGRSPQR